VYERPRTEFTARFLGGSNIIRGKALDATHLAFAGKTIACTGAPMEPGATVAVSVRQHEVQLTEATPSSSANAVRGLVVRNVFLGTARDYIVEVADGTQLRVTAPPDRNLAPGESVWLILPPERCRALSA
jgi:iron(III) transport system ATP-binding protein